jgi:DNA-binding PadR family transcriptional regulator
VVRSSDIRSQIGIGWGDYEQHLRSLEDHEYVQFLDEFDEGASVVKTVYITPYGLQEYNKLMEALKSIVDNDTAIEQVMKGKIQNLSDGGLYPSN